jgi:hypothetical protein
MNKFNLHIIVCLLAFMVSCTPYLAAQWSGDPAINVPICTTNAQQLHPGIVIDGSGGAIICWDECRTGLGKDVYVQRVDANGYVQWTYDGNEVCTAFGVQDWPAIVSDGSGGAILSWNDNRNTLGVAFDIFAQRVDHNGIMKWTYNGVPISSATNDQKGSVIVSDGAGGAVIAWNDYRSGLTSDVYVQRINDIGIVQWTSDGVAIAVLANDQKSPCMVSDGADGAIIAWQDSRNGTDFNIYAQRINASGVVQWATNGVEICSATGDQVTPVIVSDGSNGAIIAWQDARLGAGNNDIYAQRVDASGTVLWTIGGEAICTASDDQVNPSIASGENGCCFLTWQDHRNGNFDIYAQRVSSTGSSAWCANGVAVATAAFDQTNPVVVQDGSGNAVIAWEDSRSGLEKDVYSQKISASGGLLWPVAGVAVATATGNQTVPRATSTPDGGAIITWLDARNYSTLYEDVYASKVFPDGVLPVELVAFSGTLNGSDVALRWRTATETNNTGFEIQYQHADGWSTIGFVNGHGTSQTPHHYTYSDLNAVSRCEGNVLRYRLIQVDRDGARHFSPVIEIVRNISAHDVEMNQAFPNPVSAASTIRFRLATAQRVTLTIHDVLGKEVRRIFAGEDFPGGSHAVHIDASGLAAGTYVLRLSIPGMPSLSRSLIVGR